MHSFLVLHYPQVCMELNQLNLLCMSRSRWMFESHLYTAKYLAYLADGTT